MFLAPEDLLKIALAVLAGGIIGMEREFRDKAAGFRTLIFICVGATLFTILSLKLGGNTQPAHIAASIVTGVGFLGAGVILREGGRVVGLTTAALIWLTAALGMGLAGGQFVTIGIVVLIVLIVLVFFPRIDQWIDRAHEECTYQVVCPLKHEKFAAIDRAFAQAGLHVESRRHIKSGDEMTCIWQVSGPLRAHEQMREHLFADPDVKEFSY